MQFEVYNHRGAKTVVSSRHQIQVGHAINAYKPRKPIRTQKIREAVLGKLHECGWSDEIRVDPTNSKIDITSIHSEVGLCLQTGNMSRFYADLLKLQTLFKQKKIKAAVYIAPKRSLARMIGQNLVNYERFIRELDIFRETITVPILIYGIEE